MKVCIHRGTKQIGGTCIEIEASERRIIVDLGLPLDAVEADSALVPQISGLRERDPSRYGDPSRSRTIPVSFLKRDFYHDTVAPAIGELRPRRLDAARYSKYRAFIARLNDVRHSTVSGGSRAPPAAPEPSRKVAGKVLEQLKHGVPPMPRKDRRRLPFYRRREPLPQYDIRKLRPPSLPRGERFETVEDVRHYSFQSEEKLEQLSSHHLAEFLYECRVHDRRCDQPYCPICAREFRIWFIGELLRIIDQLGTTDVHILTVLLRQVPRDRIDELNMEDYDARLRKRLERSGLGEAVVIGGYENVHRAETRSFVLHVNLVVIGGSLQALENFGSTFARSEIERPVVRLELNDRAEQLSYVLKFTTYHRPFAQRGPDKGPALPLNPREHGALVAWMARWRFQDFTFLFNARRKGEFIATSKH
jgi:hypothetical protein